MILLLFHASQTPGLTILTPHISNHGQPLVYLSKRRENTLVYLSNAVEKHCKTINFHHAGYYKTWASYGFTADGLLQLDEYYPNATMDTYKGVAGYIYSVQPADCCRQLSGIPDAVIAEQPLFVTDCEYIPDAYDAIMQAVSDGRMVLRHYTQNSPEKLRWIEKEIRSEYENAVAHPEYRAFLKAKFDFLSA